METGGNSSRKHNETIGYKCSSGGSHALIFPAALVTEPEVRWLRVGKRQYCFEGRRSSYLGVGKRGEVGVEPRCQVEGCKAELGEAKNYHRRHKVCEFHSKAPFVTLLGSQQRFCQQCSRFHLVSEFDNAKRSCRRRLAGHNERRRKSSSQYVSRNYSRGCAYSLLSSKSDKLDSPSDLSSRSRAALCELIAEHRATIVARRVFEQNLHNNHTFQELVDRYRPAAGGFSSFPPASNA